MKKLQTLSLCLFVLISVLSLSSFREESDTIDKFRYTYTYAFENAASREQLQSAAFELEQLLHVVSVKTVYKEESQKGAFIVIVEEEARQKESDQLFSVKMIKTVIINNGITPIDFTLETEKI